MEMLTAYAASVFTSKVSTGCSVSSATAGPSKVVELRSSCAEHV